MSYSGAGGGGGGGAAGAGARGAAAGAGAGAGGDVGPLAGEALRRAVNLSLRQIKKLRKYELEEVRRSGLVD